MKMMAIDYDCPYTGFKKKCSKIREHCPKWVHLMGTDPNTGQLVDEFDCADRWVPLLLVESAQKTNQVGAAVESFRNEMCKQNNEFGTLFAQNVNRIETQTLASKTALGVVFSSDDESVHLKPK